MTDLAEALKLLVRIREHFLFADDDGSIGISDAIDPDLFNDICAAINSGAANTIGGGHG